MRPAITSDDRMAARHYRRARAYGVPGDFDGDEWALVRAWWGRCLCCGMQHDLALEHVVPLSRGGTGNLVNVQLLCRLCNSRKGNRVIDYRDSVALSQLLELLRECYG